MAAVIELPTERAREPLAVRCLRRALPTIAKGVRRSALRRPGRSLHHRVLLLQRSAKQFWRICTAKGFQDRSPAAYATLLDEGEYLCSIRSMDRLLKRRGESRERRDQLTHPPYQKLELLATAPNQLWSWDITKLLGPAKVDLLLSLRDPRCV